MGEREFVLEMQGISKSFPGVRALDDVTLKVRPGSVHDLYQSSLGHHTRRYWRPT